MMRFDVNDLSVSYVDILKITSGQRLITALGEKIKISKRVLEAYKKAYKVMEFVRPHKVALLMYKGHILDIQPSPITRIKFDGERIAILNKQTEVSRQNWISDIEKNLAGLRNDAFFGTGDNYYFDGTYIYSGPQSEKGFARLDKTGCFFLGQVTAINVTLLKKTDFMVGDACRKVMKMLLLYKQGDVTVVSPPFSATKFFNLDTRTGQMELFNQLFSVNVDFAIQAGTTLGELYGSEANELLDFPRLMLRLKSTNFKNIHKSIRLLTPIEIDFKSAIAWIMGFIYREKDFDNLLKLYKLFNFLIIKGVIITDEARAQLFDSTFTPKEGPLPLLSIEDFLARRKDNKPQAAAI